MSEFIYTWFRHATYERIEAALLVYIQTFEAGDESTIEELSLALALLEL